MKKKAWLFVLFLTVITSLITGTYAIYTKSFAFHGTISKVSDLPVPPPADDEDIISDPSGTQDDPNVSKDEEGTVSIRKRGDFLQLMTLPGKEYKVEVDISGYDQLHAFGIYVDGYYDESDRKIYADVIQFVNGHIEMKRRSFSRSYDTAGNLVTKEDTEDTFSSIAAQEDVAAILPDLPAQMHVSVIITTQMNKKGELVKIPEVYINDVLVPNQKYPSRAVLHSGNKAYIGYRSWWAGKPEILFQNLKVSALQAPDSEVPDVIIPETGGGSQNPNITVDGETGNVTITNAGDYVFAVDGITEDSYVISSFVQVQVDGPGNLQDHLKGFGIYIDGGVAANGAVDTDLLYFTNTGAVDELRLSSYSLMPMLTDETQVYERVSYGNDIKVTTQGETGLAWNDAKNGFYFLIAVKGDAQSGKKQIRVFTADKNMHKVNEVSQYYDTPWTGLPPYRPYYKKNNRIYVGYHSDNSDGRSISYHDLTVTNGLDKIPSELLHKYGW